jgi:hypothetical protein
MEWRRNNNTSNDIVESKPYQSRQYNSNRREFTQEDKNPWLIRNYRRRYNISSTNQFDSELFEDHLQNLNKKENDFSEMEKKIYKIKGEGASFDPIESFSDFTNLPLQLASNLKKLKFDNLTPIQKIAIPAISTGQDIIGCAETGILAT